MLKVLWTTCMNWLFLCQLLTSCKSPTPILNTYFLYLTVFYFNNVLFPCLCDLICFGVRLKIYTFLINSKIWGPFQTQGQGQTCPRSSLCTTLNTSIQIIKTNSEVVYNFVTYLNLESAFSVTNDVTAPKEWPIIINEEKSRESYKSYKFILGTSDIFKNSMFHNILLFYCTILYILWTFIKHFVQIWLKIKRKIC